MNKNLVLIFFIILSSCSPEEEKDTIDPKISILETTNIGLDQISFKIKTENISPTDYDVGMCWSLTSNPELVDNSLLLDSSTLETEVTLTNLESNTTYYFRAFLSNGSEVYYSEEIKVTTKSVQLLCEDVYKYKDEYDERATLVRKTNDGGFVVGGWTDPVFGSNHFYFNIVLLKYNSNCEILWEKFIPRHFNIYNLIEDQEGNLLLLTQENGNEASYSVIYKMDSLGNILWKKEYRKGNISALKDIIVTQDGNYSLVGTYSITAAERFGWFVQINSNGDLVKEKSYSKQEMMIGKSLVENNQELFVVGDLEYETTFLYKLDQNGDIQWRKKISKGIYDLNRSLIITNDNNLIISGVTHRLGPDRENLWVVKMDLQGNVIWENGFGQKNYLFSTSGNDSPTDIIESESGALYLTGGGRYYPGLGAPTMESNIWVFKISPENGSLMWSKEYGSNEVYTWDLSYSITELDDGELVVVGNKEDDETSTISFTGDFWIMKLKEN